MQPNCSPMLEERRHAIVRNRTHGRNRENSTGDQRTMLPVFDFDGKASPCREACPAGHDIAHALHLVQRGDFAAAWELLREESPFPSITGRVCYHSCEESCNRKDHDAPLAIAALERAIAEYGDSAVTTCPVAHPDQPVAVVGSGPAGVTAAYHLVRLGYPVTMFERDDLPGGALRYGIPRYRLPARVLDEEFGRLAAMGVVLRTGVAIGRDVSWEELESGWRAIFLGVGLGGARALAAPGVDEVGATSGLAFLRAASTGEINSLAGDVAVIGGGDVAIDVVRSAMRLGAGAVHLFCLESRETMPAHPEEIRQAEREGLLLNPAWAIERIGRASDGRIRIAFRGVARLEEGLRPILDARRMEATVDHLVVAIGQEAQIDWLPPALRSSGRVAVDLAARVVSTRVVPNVFAGGDIAGTYNVVQAIGAGKRAAIGIDSHHQGRDPLVWIERAHVGVKGTVSMRRYREALAGLCGGGIGAVVRIERVNLDYFAEEERCERPELPIARRQGFVEVNGGLAREDAVAEANRCFVCAACTICGNCFVYCPDSAVVQREDGYFAIDVDHCKGCGQCVHECPRAAMTMVLEKEALG